MTHEQRKRAEYLKSKPHPSTAEIIELLKYKPHLTTNEVGKIVHLSLTSVATYCKSGEIVSNRVSKGRRRILHEDVKAFMAKNGIKNPDYVTDKELEAYKPSPEATTPDELLVRIETVLGSTEHPKEKVRKVRQVLNADRT